ncbi:MAG: hypothetical protein IJE78_03195 [Bacteroidaceae bacterium]|nr:hypothetical protein [Bacteroidaceae bacterium]
MKKLILFIVLILGFINENKAQFAASSEIYIYISTDKPLADAKLYYILFTDDGEFEWTFGYFKYAQNDMENSLKRHESYVREKSGSNLTYYFNRDASTDKYYAYRDISKLYYAFFSKDKNIFIDKDIRREEPEYYKRISKQELIDMCKPKFDFLE